jgi:hypothetical protein
MKKVLQYVGILAMLSMACTPSKKTNEDLFLAEFIKLCGGTFIGEMTFAQDPPDDIPENIRAVINCFEADVIEIHFQIGEDKSRTLLLEKHEHLLHLKHDIRFENGQKATGSDYGGWSSNTIGNKWSQYFPADEHTIGMDKEMRWHMWKLHVEKGQKMFTYSRFIHNVLDQEYTFRLADNN